MRAARNIYILPFSIHVWAALCTLLLAITIALTFILHRESRLHEQKEYDMNEEGAELILSKWEFGEVLLVTIGAVCQQCKCSLNICSFSLPPVLVI